MTTPLKSKEDRPMKKIAIAFLALAAITACQKEEDFFQREEVPQEEEKQPQNSELYTLSLQASKTIQTKALSLDNDGATLNAHWRTGETVAVYLGGTLLGTLSATADGTDATKATLSGILTTVEEVTQGSELMLLFPRAEWDYTGQDGSAPDETGSLASKYDYATATVTVASVDDVNKVITTTSGADFENQQSIYRFGFKINGTGDAIPVKGFTVSPTNGAFVHTRNYYGDYWGETYSPITVNVASGTLTMPYVALRNHMANSSNTLDDTYHFSVIGADDALYLGQKDIPNSVLKEQGKLISAKSVSVSKAGVSEDYNQTYTAW